MAERLNIELDFGDHRRVVGQVAWVKDQRRAAIEWETAD